MNITFANGTNQEEKAYLCLIRFYMDPEINFYEKDKWLSMFIISANNLGISGKIALESIEDHIRGLTWSRPSQSRNSLCSGKSLLFLFLGRLCTCGMVGPPSPSPIPCRQSKSKWTLCRFQNRSHKVRASLLISACAPPLRRRGVFPSCCNPILNRRDNHWRNLSLCRGSRRIWGFHM